jgi:DNA-binding NarL/FixJ family response regulator
MEMNQQIYDYVEQLCKKVKNSDDREDVMQETLTILCEKGLINEVLTLRLKNYISGIVWNYSTTLFNDFHNAVSNPSISGELIPDYVVTSTYTSEREDYRKMMGHIKKYVFDNYYKKNKKLTKWRVFYLVLQGYSYKEIMARLGVAYKTVVEYNFQTVKEIGDKIGTSIIESVPVKRNSDYEMTATGHQVTNWTVSNSMNIDLNYEITTD